MIDWRFIGLMEGRKLQGYVPDMSHSNSGVTVATGCDLGQMQPATFALLNPALARKVQPYLTLKGPAAKAMLSARPLTVTEQEADELDRLEFDADHAAIIAHLPDFETYPDAAQTVVASVTYQYGTPWARCPHFWSSVVAKDWTKMKEQLHHFGDAYSSRHGHEADYLQEHGL